jgi:hypothetical protein
MARVLVWNPYRGENPRRKKALSSEQVERRQAQAVRLLRDVTDDPDRADEIEDLSVAEYAERKGFQLSNPRTRKGMNPMKQQEFVKLKEQVKELELKLAEAVKQGRSNPSVVVVRKKKAVSSCEFDDEERDELVSAIAEIKDELEEGRSRRAQEIAAGILDEYDEDEEEDEGAEEEEDE